MTILLIATAVYAGVGFALGVMAHADNPVDDPVAFVLFSTVAWGPIVLQEAVKAALGWSQ